ncbi:uncharacterized protein LOC142646256 [Dermatophagoides pteronyssinus]|uniref:uncharacterized protein LOC142646256 n=1 Tax=Dermatophagoides pteronyssinus TaxID=6956 RepID=UPI003F6751A4
MSASSKKNKEQSSSDSTSSEGDAMRTNTSAVTTVIGRTMACSRRSMQMTCWFSSICATWRYSQLL